MMTNQQKGSLFKAMCPELAFALENYSLISNAVRDFANYDWEEEIANERGYEFTLSKREYAIIILDEFTGCFRGKSREEIREAMMSCEPSMGEKVYSEFSEAVYGFVNYEVYEEVRVDCKKSKYGLAILTSLIDTFNGKTKKEVGEAMKDFITIYTEMAIKL